MINDTIKITGDVQITLFDANGFVKDTSVQVNSWVTLKAKVWTTLTNRFLLRNSLGRMFK